MKNFTSRFLWLLLIFTTTQLMCFGQEKGRISDVQAEQRTDGSDIIDVYFNLLGFQESYEIQARLLWGVGYDIPLEFCEGDYGPGILPGTNKHFTYHMGGHKPGYEWTKINIEVRAYFATGESCPGLPTVDYYGQTYETIKIGGQCWLKQNLNTGTMIDYQVLPWLDNEIEKYCYDNDPSNCTTYGALYHWWEAMYYGQATPGKQGICPTGFHIPTKEEFSLLIKLFGGAGLAGGSMKSENFWNAPNTGATNSSFFTAFGTGSGYNTAGLGGPDDCYGMGELTYFWTSSMNNDPNKPALGLYFNNTNATFLDLAAEPYPFGSVRCMKDCDTQPSVSNAGPDQTVVNGNYTTLAAILPELGIGQWVVTSVHTTNKQGILVDKWDITSGFYGFPDETYMLEWQISNECTMSTDQCEITFTTFECGENLVDYRNGKTYPTVQVGDYCWMSKNMDIGEQTGIGTYSSDGIIQKTCYNDDPLYCDEYGGLYYWSEAVQQEYSGDYRRGICPLGWFIPNDNAWCNLTSSIDATVDCNAYDNWTGTDAGGQLKESGTSHWTSPNNGASNLSGFTALGAGYATKSYPETGFHELNETARFWTSHHSSTQSRTYWYLGHNQSKVGRSSSSAYYREYSVRCVHYPNY